MNANRMGRLSVVVFAAALAVPATAQQVTMMTGPQGGSWIPLGGALKNMWEAAVPGLQIQQQPGAGIANVRGVDEGKAQIGFANSATTVDGVEGRDPFLPWAPAFAGVTRISGGCIGPPSTGEAYEWV